MRQFNQSETGQNFPGNVLLNETIADGDSGITHAVNIFYSSAGGMDQTPKTSEENTSQVTEDDLPF